MGVRSLTFAAGSIFARTRIDQLLQPVLGGVVQLTSTRASSVSQVGSGNGGEPGALLVQVGAAPVPLKICPA